MKPNYLNRLYPISVITSLLLFSFVVFNSCKGKKNAGDGDTRKDTLMPDKSDLLLSVANVYYTEDGKKAEAWFYETPLVYEFDASDSNAKRNFEMLRMAKEKNEPVNIRLNANVTNQVSLVIPGTKMQIDSVKARILNLESATFVPAPLTADSMRLYEKLVIAAALKPVVPDLTTLNTIFAKVRSLCCKLPGPYQYGQCVPFQFVADGCYARAHKARQIIESFYGYSSYKVFNFACNNTGTLSVKATLWGNNCCVKWWYHVASYVLVKVGGSNVAYLIDPSMFNGPVSIPAWVAAQKNVTCTFPGGTQKQLYWASNAYAPSGLSPTCVLSVFTDNNYIAANAKCAQYSAKQGCVF